MTTPLNRDLPEILEEFTKSDWTSLTLATHDLEIRVRKRDGMVPSTAEPKLTAANETARTEVESTAPPEAEPGSVEEPTAVEVPAGTVPVPSPTIGVFWEAPSPGAAPFVAVGDFVEAGQQVAIVEVMKLMMEVTAPLSGHVAQVIADNGQQVGIGDPLLFITAGDTNA